VSNPPSSAVTASAGKLHQVAGTSRRAKGFGMTSVGTPAATANNAVAVTATTHLRAGHCRKLATASASPATITRRRASLPSAEVVPRLTTMNRKRTTL
jgi:hypothetical protein